MTENINNANISSAVERKVLRQNFLNRTVNRSGQVICLFENKKLKKVVDKRLTIW